MASQPFSPGLGRQSSELGIFQVSRSDRECLKQSKTAQGFPRTHVRAGVGTVHIPISPAPRARAKKNQPEREGKTPPTSSTKLLLFNSLGQPQVGHKAVCVSSE